ncbi:MAG: hypothetical protein ACR2O6_11870, partial [Ilumatobacteraceae bacterium]
VEEPVDGFVIDLVRGDVLIEIQTRGFSSMKRKLSRLLEERRVHVVHPVAVDKWIVKLDADGDVQSRRRSPKHGEVLDVFGELTSFPELIRHPNLTVEVLLVEEEEVRRHDPEKAWRRKGWVIEERRLLGVVDECVLDSADALLELLPSDLPAQFTTGDLATALGRPRRLAQQMAYCLRHAEAIEAVGKDGNAVVYEPVGEA